MVNVVSEKKLGQGLHVTDGDVSADVPAVVLMDPSGNLLGGGRLNSQITIGNGASASNALDCNERCIVGFFAPAAWTAAGLQIQASADGSTNWVPITDSTGSVSGSYASITALYAYALDPVAMLPWRYIRLLSGTIAVPVNQGAARAFTVITRPLA